MMFIFIWQKKYHIEIKTEKGSTWFLVMPLTVTKGASRYEKRFSIEKCFQDQKSSGFNIEKSKIRKYARFKRLYFAVRLAQLFTVIIGEYVTNNNHPLKKSFPILEELISAFSISDTKCVETVSRKLSQS